MTLFYNSRTRKARLWVSLVLGIIPILILIIVWITTRPVVEEYKEELKKEAQEDIFDQF